MSRRFGFLSVALVLFGSAMAWFFDVPLLPAQVPGVTPVEEVPQAVVPAPPAHRKEGVFDFHAMSENEQKIQKALGDPVEIQFIDTPLKDAMDFLADAHKITILIDEQGLTEEGVAIDEPINRELSKIKLDSALKIMLEPLGLTYVIEDEVLKITTTIAANEKRTTRVYNTGYLQQIGVEPEALSKTIKAVVKPDQWRANGMSSELAARPEKPAVVSRDEQGSFRVWDVQTGKQINQALLQNVQAGGASPEPPALSSIEVLGDMLVVSAPKSVHDEIQKLLVQLDRRWELELGKQ